jgi:LPS-assembly protein
MKTFQHIMHGARILLYALLAPCCYAATLDNLGFDDWVISGSCTKDANILCNGYYKPREYATMNDPYTPNQPITITSDEASFVAKGTSVFNGNVIATQGNKIIYANKATVLHNEQSGDLEKVTASGRVQIMQPGVRVDGTEATAYVKADKQIIDNAVYRRYDNHSRGESKTLTIYDRDKMQLCPGTYTTCAPDSNAWYLKASEANFNKTTGRGEAWNARMYLKDVPVFYWPYVNFPIDDRRQTGFLQPSYESPSNNGATLIIPFYWNVAPNYDFTVTSKYMSKRSWKFDTVTRYLTRKSNGKLKFDFLPHDRAYEALRNQKYDDPAFMLSNDTATVLQRNDLKPRDFRYGFTYTHTTNFTEKFSLNIDYTDASDGNYLNDFNNNTYQFANNQGWTLYALQRGNLQYTDVFGTLKYQLEQYKTFYITNGPVGQQQLSKLPEIILNSATVNLPKNFSFVVNATYVDFKPRLVPDNNVALNYGQRFFIRPGLQYTLSEPGWFIIPRVQLNYVQYANLHLTASSVQSPTNPQGINPNHPHLAIPMYDLKTGLIFERPTDFNNVGLLQTLEPTAYFLFVPNKNQNFLPNFDSVINQFDYYQVFRDNRYAGYDRVSQASQVGLGLATKLYRETNGEELAMLGIAQIRYFAPNTVPIVETGNVDPDWSPIAIVGRLRVAPKYSFEGNFIRDNVSTKTASFLMQYMHSKHRLLNFSYEFIRSTEPDDITGQTESNQKQISASTAWQLVSQFRFLGRYTYDLDYMREKLVLAGFEYHTCCTALRFVWTKTWQPSTLTNRDYIHGFGLQFIFKGFTGVGNMEDQAIAALIPGYNANITKF